VSEAWCRWSAVVAAVAVAAEDEQRRPPCNCPLAPQIAQANVRKQRKKERKSKKVKSGLGDSVDKAKFIAGGTFQSISVSTHLCPQSKKNVSLSAPPFSSLPLFLSPEFLQKKRELLIGWRKKSLFGKKLTMLPSRLQR